MTNIYFQQLTIGTISTNSGMYTGENIVWGYRHQQKQNDGFGRNVGRQNRIHWNQHILIDVDRMDVSVQYTHKRNESG